MNKDKYEYVMRYVPMKSDIVDIAGIIQDKNTACASSANENIDAVSRACLSAIEAMSAMTAMVFMKCMDSQ